MSFPAWPATLPQNPYEASSNTPKYQPLENIVRTSVDAGPAKQRRRFTAVPNTITLPPIVLTETQRAALQTFKESTLLDVLPFTWIDFRTGAAANYRFIAATVEEFHSSDGTTDQWSVTLSLEMLP